MLCLSSQFNTRSAACHESLTTRPLLMVQVVPCMGATTTSGCFPRRSMCALRSPVSGACNTPSACVGGSLWRVRPVERCQGYSQGTRACVFEEAKRSGKTSALDHCFLQMSGKAPGCSIPPAPSQCYVGGIFVQHATIETEALARCPQELSSVCIL